MTRERVILRIPAGIVDRMIAHAEREKPLECCGLLAGACDLARSIYELENEAKSESRFLVTTGLFAPFKAMRAAGEELLAIYHSHPTSDAVPSPRDLEENFYSDTVHLIISLADAEPAVRAFLLERQSYTEIGWKIV